MQSLHTYVVQFGDYKKIMSVSVKNSVRYSTKMKILSFVFSVTLVASLSAIPGVSARANQENVVMENGVSATKQNASPFKVCIDDSDCQKIGQGDKFACFQFICYPWQDDTDIPPKDKIPICRNDRDCNDGKKCYRHQDRRRVSKGLCFDELQDCGIEEDDGQCPRGQGCCGSLCCEQKYYKQYSELPCFNPKGCQDLGLGKYCCPRKGETSVCCNTDPNPPPPKPNTVTDDRDSATSIPTIAFTSSLLFTLFFYWLM